MGQGFDEAMVHWRLFGRNTSWAGQFSSQERNQDPRLILAGQPGSSHETLLKHSEQDAGLLLFIVAITLCLVFLITLFAVFFSCKLTHCCSNNQKVRIRNVYFLENILESMIQKRSNLIFRFCSHFRLCAVASCRESWAVVTSTNMTKRSFLFEKNIRNLLGHWRSSDRSSSIAVWKRRN